VSTVRLLWVESPNSMKGWEVDVDPSFLDEGRIEPDPGSFPGPPGIFHRLPDEHCWTLEPQDPAPTFLHESYQVHLERWMNSVPDAAEEVAIVAKVRDAVIQLVDSRLAAEPDAFSAGPTVTSTEPTSQGIAVVGRCVILRPTSG
jgi:hypothetical protein